MSGANEARRINARERRRSAVKVMCMCEHVVGRLFGHVDDGAWALHPFGPRPGTFHEFGSMRPRMKGNDLLDEVVADDWKVEGEWRPRRRRFRVSCPSCGLERVYTFEKLEGVYNSARASGRTIVQIDVDI